MTHLIASNPDNLRRRLGDLELAWHELLRSWAVHQESGRRFVELVCSSLGLSRTTALFERLLADLRDGVFTGLPDVWLVPAQDLPGAAAAYAGLDQGLILLNEAWFRDAADPDVLLRLHEELGHHLAALASPEDPRGDEGARFAAMLTGAPAPADLGVRDQGIWWSAAGVIPVEQSSLVERRPVAIAAPGRSRQEQRNQKAWAALKEDGSVVAWGDPASGGDLSAVADRLGEGVVQIYGSGRAFAALTRTGAVVAWGDSGYGGQIPARLAEVLQADVVALASTTWAFAALTSAGAVITWGDPTYGGSSMAVAEQLSSGVQAVYANPRAFAALKTDGSVVTWGHDLHGGDTSAVATALDGTVDVVSISSTDSAFAALRSDGSVVTWGNSASGANSAAVAAQLQSGVKEIVATASAFAALKNDGAVVTWGNRFEGGNASAVATALDGTEDVLSISSTDKAFAALRHDGSVVTWGNAASGANSAAVAVQLQSGVEEIVATASAFAALKSDGSVVSWGNSDAGGSSSGVATALNGSVDVVSISATDNAFAALRSDGSVVTWGDATGGGDSSAVSAELLADVNEVVGNQASFAARRTDGSVVAWGDPAGGGDASGVSSPLQSGVVAFSDPFLDDTLMLAPARAPLDFDGDGLIASLQDGLSLAAALGSDSADAITDLRLDLDADDVVSAVDVQILLRFGFGTFPGEALTQGLAVDRPALEVWEHIDSLRDL